MTTRVNLGRRLPRCRRLVLAEWADPPAFAGVKIRNDLVPEDVRPDRFLATLIERVLARTPIDMHVEVREAREHRDLPFTELEEGGEADEPNT